MIYSIYIKLYFVNYADVLIHIKQNLSREGISSHYHQYSEDPLWHKMEA